MRVLQPLGKESIHLEEGEGFGVGRACRDVGWLVDQSVVL